VVIQQYLGTDKCKNKPNLNLGIFLSLLAASYNYNVHLKIMDNPQFSLSMKTMIFQNTPSPVPNLHSASDVQLKLLNYGVKQSNLSK